MRRCWYQCQRWLNATFLATNIYPAPMIEFIGCISPGQWIWCSSRFGEKHLVHIFLCSLFGAIHLLLRILWNSFFQWIVFLAGDLCTCKNRHLLLGTRIPKYVQSWQCLFVPQSGLRLILQAFLSFLCFGRKVAKCWLWDKLWIAVVRACNAMLDIFNLSDIPIYGPYNLEYLKTLRLKILVSLHAKWHISYFDAIKIIGN